MSWGFILTSARITFKSCNKAMEKAQHKPTGEHKGKGAVTYIGTHSLTSGFPYRHRRGLSFRRGCSESLPGGARGVIIYTAH